MLAAAGCVALADEPSDAPKLLLNAQRIRRLKRDRDRKTIRWVNFEKRVNTVPDSTERGFELALYYVITGDEARGREAVQWALAHLNNRQRFLILDWCRSLVPWILQEKFGTCSGSLRGSVLAPGEQPFTYSQVRDCLFAKLAFGNFQSHGSETRDYDLSYLRDGKFQNPEELYAACEIIYVFRAAQHIDLRDDYREFFTNLPNELILSLKPSQLDHPDWLMHIAALALVAIDPNLPSSQFLQGWALEDRQMIQEGPGVAYELLWADPYLPGVGYQNMDPWLYDPQGRLFARSGWDRDSCWVSISASAVNEENCPPNWRDEPSSFGKMTLLPMTDKCLDIPHIAPTESLLVWQIKPLQKLQIGKSADHHTGQADSAGIWRPGSNIEGKACISNR